MANERISDLPLETTSAAQDLYVFARWDSGMGAYVETDAITLSDLASSLSPLLTPITVTGGTVTTDSPPLNLAQTWNNGGVAFNGIKLNITNTSSDAGSRLLDLQVGGASLFSVGITGDLTIDKTGLGGPTPRIDNSIHVVGNASVGRSLSFDTFATNPNIEFRRANGTNASKSAISAGDTILAINSNGYDGSAYQTSNLSSMAISAINNWSGSDHSTAFYITLVPTGSTTAATALTVRNDYTLVPNKFAIGTTPSQLFEGSQAQDGATIGQMTNANSGGSASARWRLYNSDAIWDFGVLGTGWTTSGIYTAGRGFITGNGGGHALILSASGIIFSGTDNNVASGQVATDGRLLWNTVASVFTTGEKVSIQADTSSWAALGLTGANWTVPILGINAAGGANNYYIGFQNGGVASGSIQWNGSATVLNATSDARLKDIDVDQINRRDAIKNVYVGDFDRYSNFDHEGQPIRAFGVLAQDFHEKFGYASGIAPPLNDNDIWNAPSEPIACVALWGVKDNQSRIETIEDEIISIKEKLSM